MQIRYSDHYIAHARLWWPPQPRGAVLYLHGIQSHGLWFEESASRLAKAGFAVLLPDRRGSGRNRIDRGHTSNEQRLLRDVAEGLDELHVRTGLSRFHLVGVSWGGKLAMAFLRHQPGRVASLHLSAPGLFPRVDIPLAEKMRVAWSAVTSRRAAFDIPLNDPSLFTMNPDRQDFICQDRWALRQVTASFLLAGRQLDHMARKLTAWPAGLHVRLHLAEHDRIIDNTRTRDFCTALSSGDCRVIDYSGAHHTLEFEPQPETYLHNLVEGVLESNSANGTVPNE